MTAQRGANRGLSLVELAIAMVISGLMLAGLARFCETLQLQQALKVTRERIATAGERLDAFADKNERFPCPLPPAGGAVAPEPETCVNPNLKAGERDVATGILPAAALGLSPEEARDGWGNMLTYAVSARLTRPRGMRGVNPPQGVIGMVNGYGDNVLETPDSGRYVIISHGPEGAGGFTPQGAAIPCREGTLSAKNCHAQVVFVTTPWSAAAGPFFFDNIVAGDGARRQARLLEHIDYCGRLGKYYAPERFFADQEGCVVDDKPYGACFIDTSYIDHGVYDPFTGDWNEPPQKGWWPAKGWTDPEHPEEPEEETCKCQKRYRKLMIGTWELPLHHPDPPSTPKDDCKRAAAHEQAAVRQVLCDSDPPALDVEEVAWAYEYITTIQAKIWPQRGVEWKPAGKGYQVMPLFVRDPDTGKMVKAMALAHNTFKTRTRRITFRPLAEKNRRLTLYACTRK